MSKKDIDQLYQEINLDLGNDDLGKVFFEKQKYILLRDWLLPMLMNGKATVKCPKKSGIMERLVKNCGWLRIV